MFKIIKYKFISTLEDKKFRFLFLAYIIYINYTMLVNSGLLTTGSGDFNVDFKYALIINNFKIASLLLGIVLPIYLGYSVIGKDIESRHMDIILVSVKDRKEYIILTILGNIVVLILIQFVMLLNLLAIILALDLKLIWGEILSLNINSLLNMLVILSISTFFTIVFKGVIGVISGFVSLIIFNIHTYLVIPFVNLSANLNLSGRRILMNIVPIYDIPVEFVVDMGYQIISQIPEPYFIKNIIAYQIVFIIFMGILSVIAFNKKDL